MTREETIVLLQTIIVLYPSSRINADPLTVSIWHEMLADLPGDLVSVAVKRMAATLKFPPSVADIREEVVDAVRDASGIPIAAEAWGKVSKAISWYGFYRPEEARTALGESIWHAVQLVGGWSEVCLAERTVISAQFERRYTAMIEQQSKAVQIPAAVNEELSRLVAPLTSVLLMEEGCNVARS